MTKIPPKEKEDIKKLEDLRFFALWDKETKSYVITEKGKFLWNKRSDVKVAVFFHSGQYWRDIKDRFIIKVFKLTECFQQQKYFSELYRKNVGEFK